MEHNKNKDKEIIVNNIKVEADPTLPLNKNKKQAIKKTKKEVATTKSSKEVVAVYNSPIYTVYINMRLDSDNKGICLNILNKYGIRAYIKDKEIICGKFYDKHKASMLISKISKIGYISSIK